MEKDYDAEDAVYDVVGLELETPPSLSVQTSTQPQPQPQPPRVTITETTYDSDDSIEGYASSSHSSASSPTPSELDEIEKDPMTHVGKKMISRPVYLIDLAALMTSSRKPDDP